MKNKYTYINDRPFFYLVLVSIVIGNIFKVLKNISKVSTLPGSEIDIFSRCLLFLEAQNQREKRKNWSDPNSPIFKIPYKILNIEFFSNGLSWAEKGSFGLNNKIKIRNFSLFFHMKKSKFFWASFFFVGNKAISNCCCRCGSCSSDTISWA